MDILTEKLTIFYGILTDILGNEQAKVTGIAALVISTVALVTPCAYHAYLLYQFPGEVPMALSYLPILGNALEFGTNPLGLLQRLSKDTNGKVKEIMGLVLAGKRVCLVNDPSSFKMVFRSKKEVSSSFIFKISLMNMMALLMRPAIL